MASPIIDSGQTPDFQAMTMAQLRAEYQRLAAVVQLANDQRVEASAEIDKRRARASAQARVATLSELEKDALRDVLGP